jgi:hypothetical protein
MGRRCQMGSEECQCRPLPSLFMVINCESCLVRDLHCGDCVVSFLLGPPDAHADFTGEEISALEVLAEGGVVPPLRLLTGGASGDGPKSDISHISPRAVGDSR